jgi:hypothetical protein
VTVSPVELGDWVAWGFPNPVKRVWRSGERLVLEPVDGGARKKDKEKREKRSD